MFAESHWEGPGSHPLSLQRPGSLQGGIMEMDPTPRALSQRPRPALPLQHQVGTGKLHPWYCPWAPRTARKSLVERVWAVSRAEVRLTLGAVPLGVCTAPPPSATSTPGFLCGTFPPEHLSRRTTR